MKGTSRQLAIAEEKRRMFNKILTGMFTADIEEMDTPEAKILRATRDRINAAPASWWIEFVSPTSDIDVSEVSQIMAAVAQDKKFAVRGID